MHPIFLSHRPRPHADTYEPCRGTRKMGHTATRERLIGPRGTISRQPCGLFLFYFFQFCFFSYYYYFSYFGSVSGSSLAGNNTDSCPRALKAAGLVNSSFSSLLPPSHPVSPSTSVKTTIGVSSPVDESGLLNREIQTGSLHFILTWIMIRGPTIVSLLMQV